MVVAQRRRALPRPLPYDGIEREYAAAIRRAVVDPVHVAFGDIERFILSDLSAQAARVTVRTDAARDGTKAMLARAKQRVAAVFDTRSLHEVSRKFGQRLNRHQRLQLDRQVRVAIGAPYESLPTAMHAHVEPWVRKNVDLIVTVPERYFARLNADVDAAYSSGMHPETLARRMRARYGMAEHDARRIARDQLSKLNGQLNRARQTALGVNGYVWRGVHDNRERDCHVELDGTEQRWDDPPDGGGTDEDESGHPGDGIQCFPGATPVRLLEARVLKAYRRWYSGETTTLVTDSGEVLHATPNHPLLTPRGWIPAHLVDVGEHVFEAPAQRLDGFVADPKRGDATLEQLFGAAENLGIVHVANGAHAGFHGDGTDEKVDVVDVNGRLRFELDAGCSQRFCEKLFARADAAGLRLGGEYLALLGLPPARHSDARGDGHAAALFGRRHRGAHEHRDGPISRLDALAQELGADGCAADAEAFREALHAHAAREERGDLVSRVLFGVVRRAMDATAGLNTPSAELLGEQVAAIAGKAKVPGDLRDGHPSLQKPRRVVEKRVGVPYVGHVFNLETTSGWYVARSLIVRNCRCWAEPILSNLFE